MEERFCKLLRPILFLASFDITGCSHIGEYYKVYHTSIITSLGKDVPVSRELQCSERPRFDSKVIERAKYHMFVAVIP